MQFMFSQQKPCCAFTACCMFSGVSMFHYILLLCTYPACCMFSGYLTSLYLCFAIYCEMCKVWQRDKWAVKKSATVVFLLKWSLGCLFCCEQGVVEAIGTAASTALQGPIQVTYTEAFKSTVLPSFEQSCQAMFKQINSAFQSGTQQCKSRVQLHSTTISAMILIMGLSPDQLHVLCV